MVNFGKKFQCFKSQNYFLGNKKKCYLLTIIILPVSIKCYTLLEMGDKSDIKVKSELNKSRKNVTPHYQSVKYRDSETL